MVQKFGKQGGTLIHMFRRMRVLPLDNGKPTVKGVGFRFNVPTDHQPRAWNNPSRKAINTIQRWLSMGEEICKQPIWCHNGILWWGRNVRASRMLPFVHPHEKIRQTLRLIPRWRISSLKWESQEIEKIKKELCKIFRMNDLKITVEANTTMVNFLDVTLDLRSGKHYPFTKEGNIPLYVHKNSNHPPSILRNIPESINKRLSEISSDKECFDDAKHVYQEALNKSGSRYKLTYNVSISQTSRPRRNRRRNILLMVQPAV